MPGKPAAWYSMAITASLLPLIYIVTWRVLVDAYPAEVKGIVIGAVMTTALGAIINFWLGSSASSQRKSEQQADAHQPSTTT